MSIAIRGTAFATANASGTDVAVVIPGTIQTGDGMVLFWDAAGTGSTVATPSGWTLKDGPFDSSNGSAIRGYVFTKVAVAGDAGSTVTLTKSVVDATKRYATLIAFSDSDTTDFIGDIQHLAETVAGTSHASPTATAVGSGSWLLQGYVDRGSPASTTVTPPAGLTQEVIQVGAGGGSLTVGLFAAGPVSAGTVGGGSYTGTVSTANVLTWSLVIKPAGGSPATATPSTVAGHVSIETPTVLNGANVTVHPETVVGRAVFLPLTGQVSSTMFPDTVSGVAAIPLPAEQAQQLALVIPEITVAYAATVGTPTILIDGSPVPPPPAPTPSTTRAFSGPTRIETWPLAPGARIAVKVTVNQTLYRKGGVWLVGENLNWADLVGVDRLYQGGATSTLSDAQLDELIAEGQGQYVVDASDPFPSTFTGTF